MPNAGANKPSAKLCLQPCIFGLRPQHAVASMQSPIEPLRRVAALDPSSMTGSFSPQTDERIIRSRDNGSDSMDASAPQSALASSNSQSNYGSDFDLSELLRVQGADASITPSGPGVSQQIEQASQEPGRAESDYGSDFGTDDEAIIAGIFTELEETGVKDLAIESFEEDVVPAVARVPKWSQESGADRPGASLYSMASERLSQQSRIDVSMEESGTAAVPDISHFACGLLLCSSLRPV
jgi:hypothetical protein